ncbi:hypothetical protein [Proteiniphilum propionicum]|uniref:hypothetical protein n=1 Tax=Proteiniphilum propionicum TaxID=2829812 RepID=UPI001EEB352F|nr:hypothetical protein [Proteiniphilum propionicum]ULB34516.1 hypothetical protein KDN43_00170 [Proteiniphilum propionicum]
MKKNEQPLKMKHAIHLLPLSLIVTGIITCFLSATISLTYWDFLGLIIIVALASLITGAVLGFIFGIPRLNRDYNPGENYGRDTKYNPNTNLEDVSDWLTKIILGVTLTQLGKIPGYLQSIADYILVNADCENLNCDFARPIMIAVLIYFFVAGFISGYFYTRLYLPSLFSIMEDNRLQKAEIAIWREGANNEISQKSETDARLKIELLSKDEILILKKIKGEGNRFNTHQRMNIRERAALNVLLAKGIVEADNKGSLDKAGTVNLRIVDEDFIKEMD